MAIYYTAVGLEKNVTENRKWIENTWRTDGEQRTENIQRNQLQRPL